MAQDLDAIELDIEIARDNLAATFDEIADRMNPDNLKNRAKEVVQEALQNQSVQIGLAVAGALVATLIAVKIFK
ncbi:MAG: DUF3618 domain-containing protein [Lawsonella sp.]|nr:DUF3618 domain-containing protein [Mycobacteriales bacterium]